MKLVGANAQPRIVGLEPLPGKVNHISGNDPTKWRTGVTSYANVKYENVYPGVDLVYYGNQGRLEYDFIVKPGADPSAIALSFDGADGMEIDSQGDLILPLNGHEVRQRRPIAYQNSGGERVEVESEFKISNLKSEISNPQSVVAFHLGAYDPTQPLIIDPVLVYSTYFGGGGDENGTTRAAIAVDAAGNIYVTGQTESSDFPTASPLQPANKGGFFNADVFVAKFNPAGSALIYSTYLGGSKDEEGRDIAVDADGNAYVTGATGLGSSDFPTTPGAFKTRDGGVFVAKLSPTGALIYSAHFGGFLGAEGHGIAVDAAGQAYVTGETFADDFPIVGGFQTARRFVDAFVAKLNAAGSGILYSTYLGGSRTDQGRSIAVDASGNAYVTGTTNSTDLPTANPVQPTYGGGFDDAFVAKLNTLATGRASLVYSTYLGGSGSDQGRGIAVDADANAYVTGRTSSANFPVMSALQPIFGGTAPQGDAFVTKLSAAGTALVYSTFLGGRSSDEGNDIAVDAAGNAYVIGTTFLDFPIVNPFLRSERQGGDSNDAFVAKLNAAGSALFYSSRLGGDGHVHETGLGIAVDAMGNAYVTGQTDSINFPTVNPMQPAIAPGGNCQARPCPDAFVAKIADGR
jgi:hypothetical protein